MGYTPHEIQNKDYLYSGEDVLPFQLMDGDWGAMCEGAWSCMVQSDGISLCFYVGSCRVSTYLNIYIYIFRIVYTYLNAI